MEGFDILHTSKILWDYKIHQIQFYLKTQLKSDSTQITDFHKIITQNFTNISTKISKRRIKFERI